MSSTPASDAGPEPSPVATALSSGAFLRVFTRPSGDAVAAAGVIARAARAAGTGFQLRTTRETTVADEERGAEDGRAIAVGWDAPDAVGLVSDADPLAVAAAEAVRDAGLDPDPILTLAGAFAAGVQPGAGGTGALIEAAERRDAVVERPGVAVPTADVADGLAHSTR
ncbi:MAG: exonuclease RecJ, partial [Halobaculum sp.]